MNDTMNIDVAGSLFTTLYRNVKIKGQEAAPTTFEGTGSVSLYCCCVRDTGMMLPAFPVSLNCPSIACGYCGMEQLPQSLQTHV